MNATPPIGSRGRLVGGHLWAGESGEIVRLQKIHVWTAAVVRLDRSGQEVLLFNPSRHWLPKEPKAGGSVVGFPPHDPEAPDEDGVA